MKNEDKLQLVTPCGYCCLSCPAYENSQCTDELAIQKEAARANLPVEKIKGDCAGCRTKQGKPHGDILCQTYDCCVNVKGLEFCYQCDDFPCDHINNFPFPVGKKVMLRAIPQWREMGTEKWVEAEEKRYICPHCGYKLFRGAQRCRNCKEPVDQD